MKRADIEKRLQTRYPPTIYVSVFDAISHKFFGLLADLSQTGFKLCTQLDLSTNKHYELALRNPFSGTGNDFNRFSVTIKWSKKNPDGIYEAGFEFINFSDESKALFERLKLDFETTAKAMNAMEEL